MPVEGVAIIPNWSIVKVSVPDARLEDFDTVFVPFDVTDNSVVGKFGGKQSSPPPGK
jgi:hypothetical protein